MLLSDQRFILELATVQMPSSQHVLKSQGSVTYQQNVHELQSKQYARVSTITHIWIEMRSLTVTLTWQSLETLSQGLRKPIDDKWMTHVTMQDYQLYENVLLLAKTINEHKQNLALQNETCNLE